MPERWQDFEAEGLTALEENAAKLLMAAGFVERRYSVRLSLIGHPVRIEFTATITGEHGLAQAMEPVLRKAWEAWAEFYREHQHGTEEERPQLFCEKVGPQRWRLTDQGVLARKDLAASRREVVLDFVLRRSDAFTGKVVPGNGRAERIEATHREDKPGKVEVTNLAEVTGPLKEMVGVLQAAFEKMAASAQPAAAEAKGSDKEKRAKPGPDRMSAKDAWRRVTIVQAWAAVQKDNRSKRESDRRSRRSFATEHGITPKELDAILSWYGNYRRQKTFPKDPLSLSKGEVMELFE